MSIKKKNAFTIILIFMSLSFGVFLITSVFQENIVFFYNPSDIAEKKPTLGKNIRVGGLVEEYNKNEKGEYIFKLTDYDHNVVVVYKGILPNLFRRDQGVVVEGVLKNDNIFYAKNILIKHDEKYMPREIQENLKKKGYWKG